MAKIFLQNKLTGLSVGDYLGFGGNGELTGIKPIFGSVKPLLYIYDVPNSTYSYSFTCNGQDRTITYTWYDELNCYVVELPEFGSWLVKRINVVTQLVEVTESVEVTEVTIYSVSFPAPSGYFNIYIKSDGKFLRDDNIEGHYESYVKYGDTILRYQGETLAVPENSKITLYGKSSYRFWHSNKNYNFVTADFEGDIAHGEISKTTTNNLINFASVVEITVNKELDIYLVQGTTDTDAPTQYQGIYYKDKEVKVRVHPN